VQNSVLAPWIEKAVNPDNNLSAADALGQALDELKKEVEEMKNQ
jgi:hypothetical protein